MFRIRNSPKSANTDVVQGKFYMVKRGLISFFFNQLPSRQKIISLRVLKRDSSQFLSISSYKFLLLLFLPSLLFFLTSLEVFCSL